MQQAMSQLLDICQKRNGSSSGDVVEQTAQSVDASAPTPTLRQIVAPEAGRTAEAMEARAQASAQQGRFMKHLWFVQNTFKHSKGRIGERAVGHLMDEGSMQVLMIQAASDAMSNEHAWKLFEEIYDAAVKLD